MIKNIASWLFKDLGNLAAVIALGLSVFNWREARQTPEVLMTMPVAVRITQSQETQRSGGIFVQPTFANVGTGSRVEVITGIRLRACATGQQSCGELRWAEQVSFPTEQADPTASNIDWQWVGDPAPFAVAPTTPQAPICYFVPNEDWDWQPMEYEVSVIAARATDSSDQIIGNFKIEPSLEEIEEAMRSGKAVAIATDQFRLS